MRGTAATLCLLVLASAVAEPTGTQSSTAKALAQVRKACELVWANAAPYQIRRCTERAMAALGEDERLRDNELKRMLIESENELEACRAELADLRDDIAASETTAAKRNPRFPSRR